MKPTYKRVPFEIKIKCLNQSKVPSEYQQVNHQSKTYTFQLHNNTFPTKEEKNKDKSYYKK